MNTFAEGEELLFTFRVDLDPEDRDGLIEDFLEQAAVWASHPRIHAVYMTAARIGVAARDSVDPADAVAEYDSACRDFYRSRDRVKEIIEKLSSGEMTGADAKQEVLSLFDGESERAGEIALLERLFRRSD